MSAGAGTQLGYVVQLFIPGGSGDIVIKKAAGELYHILDRLEKSSSMYFVQVAAISEIQIIGSLCCSCYCRCDLLLELLTALGVSLCH